MFKIMALRCYLSYNPAKCFMFLWMFQHLVDSGIYPDILHILDLAIYFDLFASAFLTWTDSPTIFAGRSRDDRLLGLYRRYLQWCLDNRNFTLSYSTVSFFCFYFPLQRGEKQKQLQIRNTEWMQSPANFVSNIHFAK